MMEELSKLVGGVKGQVIGALARNYPLSAKQVFSELQKRGSSVTYQGVHKALSELDTAEVILKSSEGYALNRSCFSKLSQECALVICNHDAKHFSTTRVKSGSFANAFRAMDLLKHMLLNGHFSLTRDELLLDGNRVTMLPLRVFIPWFMTFRGFKNRNYLYYSCKKLGIFWYRTLRDRGIVNHKLEEEVQLGMDTMGLAGWGNIDFEFLDLDKKIARGILTYSPVATEYVEQNGKSKTPVDDWVRGATCGALSVILGEPSLDCLETECIAKGDTRCVFEYKPRKDFNFKDMLVKKQLRS